MARSAPPGSATGERPDKNENGSDQEVKFVSFQSTFLNRRAEYIYSRISGLFLPNKNNIALSSLEEKYTIGCRYIFLLNKSFVISYENAFDGH